jgi:hypothetical protein
MSRPNTQGSKPISPCVQARSSQGASANSAALSSSDGATPHQVLRPTSCRRLASAPWPNRRANSGHSAWLRIAVACTAVRASVR